MDAGSIRPMGNGGSHRGFSIHPHLGLAVVEFRTAKWGGMDPDHPLRLTAVQVRIHTKLQ